MISRLNVSALGTYDWARQQMLRVFSRTEQDALVKQVEELKAQLQMVEEQSCVQEQKVTEFSTNLESEMNENKSLWDQVEYLTNELQKERTWRKQQNTLYSKEKAKCFEEQTLRRLIVKELEDTKKHLAHEKLQNQLLASKEAETRKELETFTVSYHKCNHWYETELNIERERNYILQQQLETEMASRADIVSEYQQQVQRLEESLAAVQTPELLEEAEDEVPEKTKKSSLWKKTCHFFSLRKKKKEKQEKESTGH